MSTNEEDVQSTTDGLNGVDVQHKLEEQREEIESLKSELDEVRKNAEKNKKIIQQLEDKLNRTEQSLQQQSEVNTQLQSQVDRIFKFTWPAHLNHLASSGNKIVPAVIKLALFDREKQSIDLAPFYTSNRYYKMFLRIFPNGEANRSRGNHISVAVYLMKGEHDNPPSARGTLTVQLLNQLNDNNTKTEECNILDFRVVSKPLRGASFDQFISHERLCYDADKKCQYLKDDCLFFSVCFK